MSTKTKYGKRGIAALCGAAVLFVGEMTRADVFVPHAEQEGAEKLPVRVEAPADGVASENNGLVPQTESGADSLTEQPGESADVETEQSETSSESETEQIENTMEPL